MRMNAIIPAATAAVVLMCSTAFAADFTKGRVVKFDESARAVTLDHGDIKNLDMPAMTMTFRVGPDVDVAKLKPGSDVEFTADSVGDEIVVTDVK